MMPDFRIAAIACILPLMTMGAFAQDMSTADRSFSKEQVERGEELYQQHCASCHGLNLIAVDDEAINLVGTPFKFSFGGKTIAEKWALAYGTMPPNNPGSLEQQQYLDILTYIMASNGIPTGDEELTVDDPIDTITIEVK